MVNFQSIRKMKTNPKTFQEERDPLKAPFYWDKWWLKQEKLEKISAVKFSVSQSSSVEQRKWLAISW